MKVFLLARSALIVLFFAQLNFVYAAKKCSVFQERDWEDQVRQQISSDEASDDQNSASLRENIIRKSFLFFRHRMRPPTLLELSNLVKEPDLILLRNLTSDPSLWQEGLSSAYGRHIEYARKRIKTAYARAVRGTDTANVFRTRRVAPTLRRIVEIMIFTKSNEQYQWRAKLGNEGKFDLLDGNRHLNEKKFETMMNELVFELEVMLGMKQSLPMARQLKDQLAFGFPVLFPGGLREIHESAVAEFQGTFRSFEDIELFSWAKAERTLQKITESEGFLISEIRAGLEPDWEMINGMLEFARRKKYPLILIPAERNFHDLDPAILNHPEIFLLTETIVNSELVLYQFPNNMRAAASALSPLDHPGMVNTGQQAIINHHTMVFKIVPKAENHVNQTQHYSTGSVNLHKVASVGSTQRARAIRVESELKQGFLVVQKIDSGREDDLGGVGNHWHIKPVEYRSQTPDDSAGFTFERETYYTRFKGRAPRTVKIMDDGPLKIYVFDLHDLVANPQIMKALGEYIEYLLNGSGREVLLVFPDPIDSKAINSHVEVKQSDHRALRSLMESGQLSFEDEINSAIANVNIVLRMFPKVKVMFQYSNHSNEWIDRNLINNPTWLQRIANGALISEIMTACQANPSWSPLEYLLIHRQRFLAAINLSGTDRYKEKGVFVDEPARIIVPNLGDVVKSRDDDPLWRVAVYHHGHKGANGAKSSPKTHRRGENRSIMGDAHTEGYFFAGKSGGWIGVGASDFRMNYSVGGMNSWGVGIALIGPLNTMSLSQLDPRSVSFYPRAEVGPLPSDEFFNGDSLVLKPANDDDVGRREHDSQEFKNWLTREIRWLKQASGF